MEITAFSKYDCKTVKKFNNFHNFKKNKLKRATVPILLIGLAISILGFSVCFALDSLDSTLITLLIIEILAVLLLLFTWFIMPKINFNINKISKNNKNEYVFKNETVCISSETNGMNANSEIDYKKFRSIYETEDFFYLYISMNQAFIVDKSTVSGGSAEDIRNILIKAVGEKYKFKK